MTYIRRGSSNVSELSGSSLWVENLTGVVLDDLVTIRTDRGETFVGHVVEIDGERCHVRICDGDAVLDRSSLQVWVGSEEIELPSVPPKIAGHISSPSVLHTGIAPLDTLFPLQHGQFVFVAGVTLHRSLGFASSMLHGALAGHQWPCLVSLDTSENEAEEIGDVWHRMGLEGEGLFLSHSRDPLYRSMAPLRLGVEAAIAHANEGRDVFMMVLDLESWFRFYQEDLALRGYYRSRTSALNGFKNELVRYIELLQGHKGRITVVMLLSERMIAGMPSELLELRDLFDSYLVLSSEGGLALDGYTPQPLPGTDRSVEYARMLRRQCKELKSRLDAKRRDEYPFTAAERAYETAMREFLLDTESRGIADPKCVWQILGLLPESSLGRVPPALLREYGMPEHGELDV